MKLIPMNPVLRSLRWITTIVALAAAEWGSFTSNRELALSGAGSLACIVLLIGWQSYRRIRNYRSRFDDAAGEDALHGPEWAHSAGKSAAAELRKSPAAPDGDGNLDSLVEHMLADGTCPTGISRFDFESHLVVGRPRHQFISYAKSRFCLPRSFLGSQGLL